MNHYYDYEEDPEFSDSSINSNFIPNSYFENLRRDSFGDIKPTNSKLGKSLYQPFRASTAPARPLTELEEFRRSANFLLIESCQMLS